MKIKFHTAGRIDIGRPAGVEVYKGEIGDVIDVPDDIAEMLAGVADAEKAVDPKPKAPAKAKAEKATDPKVEDAEKAVDPKGGE